MAGKKGTKHYSEEYKELIRNERKNGVGIRELSRKYGVSKYSVESWCGLRPEVELRRSAPLPKGRPPKNPQAEAQIIQRLRMENELLRNFLSVVGRR